MADYAVMMLSCDAYRDIWPVFIGQFKKYWRDFDGTFFLNTESDHSYKDDIIEIRYPDKKYDSKHNWAGRLKDCLRQIKEEYVLLILDDFAITEQVNTNEIARCMEHMKKDKSIACFNFRSIKGPFVGEIDGRYLLADRKAPFRINLQAALWRKSFLMKFIRKHENPWQFESWGTKRAERYKDKIYHLKKGEKTPIEYPNGGIIADRRWLGDETVEWLKKEGYNIDISQRGVYHWGDDRKTEIVHRSFIEKCEASSVCVGK